MQDKLENNYSVYQHVTPDGMYYFGQTQNVERRWRNNGAEYKGTTLQPYIEQYGWENIQHIVLFKEQTRENALWIENFLIETAREDGVCINKNRSGNVSKEEGYRQEYREQNKNKIKKYQQEYFQKNKDKKQDYDKKYREQNKQQIQEQKQQYYEQNKQQIREQQKQYYEQNKDKKQQYYEQNKDKILEQQKQYREQNKDKRREYQREYRQRKKEEKQFDGYITLF